MICRTYADNQALPSYLAACSIYCTACVAVLVPGKALLVSLGISLPVGAIGLEVSGSPLVAVGFYPQVSSQALLKQKPN